ncbi:Uncharacterised protein [Enterobacter hormaechei]|nr:Uncharacterised protein [Enterobacter hormaechei]
MRCQAGDIRHPHLRAQKPAFLVGVLQQRPVKMLFPWRHQHVIAHPGPLTTQSLFRLGGANTRRFQCLQYRRGLPRCSSLHKQNKKTQQTQYYDDGARHH